MSQFIYFTPEEKARAQNTDLVSLLRAQGERPVRSGREFRTPNDPSITVRGNKWFDHSARVGGYAVSFVQRYYRLPYQEAVLLLLGKKNNKTYEQAKPAKEAPKPFALPEPYGTMRRMYAYLMRQRHIDREVISAFVHEKLLYEDKHHNCVFVGLDDSGEAKHAHIRSTNSEGQVFRMNIEGSASEHCFHKGGTDKSLYVFEAPIDLLAFLTLYPEAWREHSYVALCGTSEQAMLWMLEKDPRLQKVVLCLDHDAAGIEATGRLTDILVEHGYTRVSILRPEYKDWDEDLKALHGLPAQSAEQHPQLQAAEFVCARIAVKCMDLKPDRAEQRVPALFQFYRRCLQEKKLETAMDCMEEIAALSLLVTLRECRQLGTTLTPAQGSQYLQSHILPHQNRMAIRNRTEEISAQLQTALAKSGAPGVRGEAEKREIASAWLELALSCAKVSVKNDADELKAMEKQKQALGMEMG